MTTPAPAEGPATLPAVASWLGIPDGDPELDHARAATAAVNAWIRSYMDEPPEGAAWPADVAQGAVMLAARVTRRRNSPGGVESFGDMSGAAYVARWDADLERLLRIGGHRRIVVG